MAEQQRFKIAQAFTGLNLDSIPSQKKEGELSYALNAQIENFDGNQVTYQNENANTKCLDLPEGYTVIGNYTIPEDNKTILFLVNSGGDSEIGYFLQDECTYNTIINARCLNFNIDYPIQDVTHKRNKCDVEIYWTDGLNPRRWLDLGHLPYATIEAECGQVSTDDIDCNKLNVQPDFEIPIIEFEEVNSGGALITGTYQFAVQYANSTGDGYTSYYSITPPVSIFEHRYTQDFNYSTDKSIKLKISNLDISGVYTHINLAVVKTINNIPSFDLVGTYDITGSEKTIVYTGTDQTAIKLTEQDVFQRNPYYRTAGGLSKISDILVWYDLKTQKRGIYQGIANKVKVQWITTRIPQKEAYIQAVNTAKYRGYMRDEVYPLEIQFILKNGKETDGFHIPGREATSYDLTPINNNDVAINEGECEDPITSAPRWKVYNTAAKLGFTQEYLDNINDDCYVGSHEYGDFSYWESDRVYPCNEDIWGELAGKPIRHHKFPDNLVTNHYGDDSIYPIGIRIDRDSIIDLIRNSDLTQEDKDEIAGFRILRGNRINNKSVVAKGLFSNVGKYTKENRDYFYPNYNYNDVREDFYLAIEPTDNDSGTNEDLRLQGFSTDDSKKRYAFHSPDTHFYQPTLGNQIKLETIEQGKALIHFVEVKDHAKYKFLRGNANAAAVALGLLAAVAKMQFGIGSTTPLPDFGFGLEVYQLVLEIIEKVIPYRNFAVQYNSVGRYTSSFPIQNTGNKIRGVDLSAYLLSGMQSVGDINTVNNFQRESSVYLRTTKTLPFTHEQGGIQDVSRVTLASEGLCENQQALIERDISSYYGSIKRIVPGQYGDMYSYETISTGFQFDIDDYSGDQFVNIYGGDIFINKFSYKTKVPFFIDHRVGNADGSDVDYQELHNIAYPIYWMSTDSRESGEDSKDFGEAFREMMRIRINNFACRNDNRYEQKGRFYLFAYGIPTYWGESEVNVDYRQSSNTKEGTFYPQVSGEIPDDWLQEKEVSIQHDNIYFYNRSFSKQIKELYVSHVPEDYTEQTCVDVFPNRAIYSERDSSTNKNNWLVYKPVSKEDFPYSYGRLISIESLENKAFLVRFENRSQIYNALLTAQTNNPISVYLGNDNLFGGGPALDFADTNIGYNGTQHKLFIRTEFGHITCDSMRGKVFLIRGTKLEEISAKNTEKFFRNNLPFTGTDIDNNYKGRGLTGTYDNVNKRIILTKLDGDKSFTASYSFKTESWISFHSYKPNYYIESSDHFFSGIPGSIWRHNTGYNFNNFYGIVEPYIIEYPISYSVSDEIFQSVVDFTTVLKYNNLDEYYQVDNVYFTKSIISNNQQTSGVRYLIPRPKNSLKQYMSYPKVKADGIDILVSKSDNKYQYNMIWDVVKDINQPIFVKGATLDKELNVANIDYTSRAYTKRPLRAKDLKIRHILDDTDEYKFISKFMIHETQISYK